MNLFKVWNQTRDKKCLIVVPSENVFVNLVLKASQKLDVSGVSLVLESDGTTVDEDQILLAVKDQTLILLEKDEVWIPSRMDNIQHTTDESPSTITLSSSDNSFIESETSSNMCEENSNQKILNVEIINVASNSEYLWSKFEIPWDKIPQDMLIMCEKGDRKKSVITEIVHIIVNHLRKVSELIIPAKVLKIVANKMCEKYPVMFRDYDSDGVVMADGSCSIFCKLQERAAYLRRPHKIPSNSAPVLPPRLNKKKMNVMSGCTNWETNLNIDDEDVSSKDKLNKMDVSNEKFYLLQEKTYANQRLFLNNIANPPTVDEIKQEWPVLFKKESITWHFKRLTNVDLDLLPKSVQEKAPKIVEFGIKIKVLNSASAKKMDEIEASLFFFAKYFKEDLSYFWTKLKESQSIEAAVKTSAPCIVETRASDTRTFHICMESKIVAETESCLEAIKLTFGFYFVFNLEYPKEVSTVLELIQRFYLKIHPDHGSRSKKQSASKKRVIGLINKMKNV